MQLYTPEHGRLCRYVQSFVWDKEEAKDIISETTLHAFEQFAHLKSQEKFVLFLFGIARNQFLKYLRKKQLTGSLEEHQLVSKFSEQNADTAITLKFELMRLLEKLNPLQKELLVLFEISGLVSSVSISILSLMLFAVMIGEIFSLMQISSSLLFRYSFSILIISNNIFNVLKLVKQLILNLFLQRMKRIEFLMNLFINRLLLVFYKLNIFVEFKVFLHHSLVFSVYEFL
jgi:RNA polymerase sigma factor (sigma-70 family)